MDEQVHLLDGYLSKFCNRTDAYYVQWTDGVALEYRARYGEVNHRLLRQHLAGELTLAFPCLGDFADCKWGCWDFDTEDGAIGRLQDFLARLGLAPLREGRRNGREGHLWLLVDSPVPAEDFRLFATEIAVHCKLDQVEFFPKQSQQAKLSNPVRAPLGIHRKPGANNERGWFEGPPRDLNSQLSWLQQARLNDSRIISAIAEELRTFDRFTIKKVKQSSELDPVLVFADLEPQEHDGYFSARCPSCDERRAYFYSTGNVLKCNRVNNCGFTVSVSEWANGASDLAPKAVGGEGA